MFKYYYLLICFSFASLWSLNWSAPITLSDTSRNAAQADLSVSESTGRAVAAWVMIRDLDTLIQVSLFNGTTWSAPVTLSDISFDSEQPAVGINSLGHAIVTWRQSSGSSSSQIKASFYNGMTWGTPVTVSSATQVDDLRFAINPTEDAGVAAWKAGSGIANVQVSQFDGASWSVPVSFVPQGAPGNVQVAINEAGTEILNWISGDSPIKTVLLSVFSGSWGSAVTPSSANSNTLSSDVAIDPTANVAAAIWCNLDTVQVSIWNGMGWLAAQTLATGSSFFIDPVICYHSSNHSAAAVWRTSGSVQGSVYIPSSWSAPLVLSEIGFSPDLSFNPTNNRVGVVWKTDDRIQYSEFNSMTVSNPVDLSSISSSLEGPKIGFDSSGNATVIWSLTNGSKKVVQVTRGS